MESLEDRDEKLNKLVEAWHAYGGQFSSLRASTAARPDHMGTRRRGI